MPEKREEENKEKSGNLCCPIDKKISATQWRDSDKSSIGHKCLGFKPRLCSVVDCRPPEKRHDLINLCLDFPLSGSFLKNM